MQGRRDGPPNMTWEATRDDICGSIVRARASDLTFGWSARWQLPYETIRRYKDENARGQHELAAPDQFSPVSSHFFQDASPGDRPPSFNSSQSPPPRYSIPDSFMSCISCPCPPPPRSKLLTTAAYGNSVDHHLLGAPCRFHLLQGLRGRFETGAPIGVATRPPRHLCCGRLPWLLPVQFRISSGSRGCKELVPATSTLSHGLCWPNSAVSFDSGCRSSCVVLFMGKHVPNISRPRAPLDVALFFTR